MNVNSPSVLFVCLGNICRSPLAEAAFRNEAASAGLDVLVDSAGTGDWHVGGPPDPRAQATAKAAGIDIRSYKARQIERADFHRFTHIVAMDRQNLADIRAMMPSDSTAEVSLLLDQVPGREGADIADPYYDGEENFDATWEDAVAGAKALVRKFSA